MFSRPDRTVLLGDSAGSWSGPVSAKHDNSNDGGFTFPGPDIQTVLENNDGNPRGHTVNQGMKTGPRAGLVERMAARAGHNAPRLNTDIIKPADGSQNQHAQSANFT
ncbi:hypothetical protein L1987_25390 [Smallanthus sonchifolius]|uniref:Uncharacterized protein n=1 Tax=Smallanthus sonchifolius TaxID=185202 RepID=A0ACB9IPF4_9ASTR|nr:hypothetical protein L1987_25390 [Smallanthus sonchifolius]